MAQREKPRKHPRRWHRRAAAVVVWAFPLFVGAGMLAPGFVEVSEDAPPAASGGGGGGPSGPRAPTASTHPLDRKPLLIPRDFSAGFVPELLDPDFLFSGTRYEPEDGRTARLTSFPFDQGDTIVIDDVDEELEDVIFEDALLVGAVVPSAKDLLAGGPHSLPNPIPLGDGLRDDDFVSISNDVIPEPATGLLLALGITALGWTGRRR